MTNQESKNKSPDNKQANASPQTNGQSHLQHQLVAMQEEYHGPLPPPEMLRKYEQIYAGTAELILQQFKSESEHRRSIEQKMIDAQIKRENAEEHEIRRGQMFALTIGIVGLLVGGAVALFSKSDTGAYAGACIGGATLVGLVTTFIIGHRTTPPKPVEQEANRQTNSG